MGEFGWLLDRAPLRVSTIEHQLIFFSSSFHPNKRENGEEGKKQRRDEEKMLKLDFSREVNTPVVSEAQKKSNSPKKEILIDQL